MLLVIDVGNTNTVLGAYQDKVLVSNWRIRTERNITEDEFSLLVSQLLARADVELARIKKTVISCVVPPMVRNLNCFCQKYLGHSPKWVNAKTSGILPILMKNPSEVGGDRIVNAVGAYHRYQQSLIVIDFGTATTFDAISDQGAYIGGAISPGIMISAEALFMHASKLPRVEIFQPPENVVGKDSIQGIQSGIIFGYAALVDGMVSRMKKEMKTHPKVVATGGLASLMKEVSESIESVENDLTLEGLRIISESI